VMVCSVVAIIFSSSVVSQTKPGKFVVFFVKDKGAPVLVPSK
jgi:hypothetical protein